MPMDKSILRQYEDACMLIRETEEDIAELEKKKCILHDSVKGSMSDHPYIAQSFHISGTGEDPGDRSRLNAEYDLLRERKKNAENIKKQVDAYMNTIPVRMQRIIRFKILKHLSWDEVSVKMGENKPGDTYRMELKRFLEKN